MEPRPQPVLPSGTAEQKEEMRMRKENNAAFSRAQEPRRQPDSKDDQHQDQKADEQPPTDLLAGSILGGTAPQTEAVGRQQWIGHGFLASCSIRRRSSSQRASESMPASSSQRLEPDPTGRAGAVEAVVGRSLGSPSQAAGSCR